MFVDALLANLLVFAVGQLFAWLYLRTGRFWVGTITTTLLWGTLDWWLVARLVFAVPAADQRLPLLLMQAAALITTVAYVVGRSRRRMAAPRRAQRFRDALRHLLAGELVLARSTFRQLVRSDPWDAAAWIALGDVSRRSAESRRACWCYRRARGVDIGKHYTDLLQHRANMMARSTADRPAPVAPRPAPRSAPEAEVVTTTAE